MLGLFFLLPLVLMLGVSGAERGVYGGLRPIADLAAYLRSGAFLASYRQSLQALYLGIAWRSLWMAALTTGLCLAIGFPAAYALALQVPRRRRGLLLGLVVMPLWTSFLIRTYAWMFILRSEGLLNHLLLSTGLASRPLPMLYTGGAVIVGLVYGELPFMILPLYAALERLDRTLLEAAADLGAGRAAVVRRVTVPLALPGLVAGVVLVFRDVTEARRAVEVRLHLAAIVEWSDDTVTLDLLARSLLAMGTTRKEIARAIGDPNLVVLDGQPRPAGWEAFYPHRRPWGGVPPVKCRACYCCAPD